MRGGSRRAFRRSIRGRRDKGKGMQAPSCGLLDDACVSPQKRSTTIWSEPLPDGSSRQGPLGVDSGCSGQATRRPPYGAKAHMTGRRGDAAGLACSCPALLPDPHVAGQFPHLVGNVVIDDLRVVLGSDDHGLVPKLFGHLMHHRHER